ncbi:RNAse R [Anopheles sinensis]|uniref:RNAse R n=1 Tax=Anopheles sinensis TaxID=74873 RepID=A0A084WHK3_ANOSI|nr:RNAse R [Anopheles sinensis]
MPAPRGSDLPNSRRAHASLTKGSAIVDSGSRVRPRGKKHHHHRKYLLEALGATKVTKGRMITSMTFSTVPPLGSFVNDRDIADRSFKKKEGRQSSKIVGNVCLSPVNVGFTNDLSCHGKYVQEPLQVPKVSYLTSLRERTSLNELVPTTQPKDAQAHDSHDQPKDAKEWELEFVLRKQPVSHQRVSMLCLQQRLRKVEGKETELLTTL